MFSIMLAAMQAPSSQTSQPSQEFLLRHSSLRPRQRAVLPHSGYRKLIVYRKSEVIYQGTVVFCRRFLPAYGDRTVDQMTQAARSCKQNIAEGSAAAAVSLETQLKLTGVARASLDELLEDVHDWLVAHQEEEWCVEDSRTAAVRDFARRHESWDDWQEFFETRPAETLCNVLAVLIHQCQHLLERMMGWQEADFARHGGVRERMRAVRDGVRGEFWEQSLFSWLNGVANAEELAERTAEAQETVRRMAASIRRRKGFVR